MSEAGPLNVHASLVRIGANGILVRGGAQSGKSSLALCLLRLARREGFDARLVADDRVDLARREDGVVGTAPAVLTGLLEIAGIGLVRLPVSASAPISLVVDLSPRPPRLPQTGHCDLLGVLVDHIALPERSPVLGAEIVLTLLDPTTERVDLEATD